MRHMVAGETKHCSDVSCVKMQFDVPSSLSSIEYRFLLAVLALLAMETVLKRWLGFLWSLVGLFVFSLIKKTQTFQHCVALCIPVNSCISIAGSIYGVKP